MLVQDSVHHASFEATSISDIKTNNSNNNTMPSPTSIVGVVAEQEIEPMSLLRSMVKQEIIEVENDVVVYNPKPTWSCLPASAKALRTTNPIRAIVDPIVTSMSSECGGGGGTGRADGKSHISLALGDPTTAGNLFPCPAAVQAVQKALQTSHHAAGYAPACGTEAARQAIADFHSLPRPFPDYSNDATSTSAAPPPVPLLPIQSSNVIVANGCSGALEIALTALLDPHSILLVPQPGFPLYQVIAESHGAAVVHYRLIPQHDTWECDVLHMRQLLQQYGTRVRAVVVNNPSNPTGAVFSHSHLQDVIHMCNDFAVPIVADEVYGDLTYGPHQPFYPVAQVAYEMGSHVPVITASGLAKQFLLPGWRVGWIVFHDNIHGSLRQVEAGAKRLAQVILGASHLVQEAIPAALAWTPANRQWHSAVRAQLREQAIALCRALSAPAASSSSSSSSSPNPMTVLGGDTPAGAMYAMVRLDVDQFDDTIQNELDFTQQLLREENVFVLPGSCFGIANVFRVVYCAPVPVLEEAAARIVAFCQRHAVALPTSTSSSSS